MVVCPVLVWLLYRADFPRSYRSAVRNTCDSHLQVMHRTTQATHKAISETNSHKMIKAGKVHLFLLSPSYTYYRNRLMLSMALDRVHAHLLFFLGTPCWLTLLKLAAGALHYSPPGRLIIVTRCANLAKTSIRLEKKIVSSV